MHSYTILVSRSPTVRWWEISDISVQARVISGYEIIHILVNKTKSEFRQQTNQLPSFIALLRGAFLHVLLYVLLQGRDGGVG